MCTADVRAAHVDAGDACTAAAVDLDLQAVRAETVMRPPTVSIGSAPSEPEALKPRPGRDGIAPTVRRRWDLPLEQVEHDLVDPGRAGQDPAVPLHGVEAEERTRLRFRRGPC